MLKKILNRTIQLHVCCALAAALLFRISAAAQSERATVNVYGLIQPSDLLITAGESVEFTFDQSLFQFYNLAGEGIFAVSWSFGDGTFIRQTFNEDVDHIYEEPGIYPVNVYLFSQALTVTSGLHIEVTAQQNSDSSENYFLSVLKIFDFDDDDRISDQEFVILLESWVMAEVGDSVFMLGVDHWVTGLPITTPGVARAEGLKPLIQQSGSGSVIFSALWNNASKISVEIFDSAGTPIYQGHSNGPQLWWNMATNAGRPIANGVYYSVITTQNSDGATTHHVPQALVVLR